MFLTGARLQSTSNTFQPGAKHNYRDEEGSQPEKALGQNKDDLPEFSLSDFLFAVCLADAVLGNRRTCIDY